MPALLLLALAAWGAGCGGGAGPDDGPAPDPDTDGCVPYGYYRTGDVPSREAAGWIGGLVQQVAVDGDRAVVAARTCGLRVVDVADPLAPHLLGAAELPLVMDVSTDGDLAAAAEGDRGVSLWSLEDPARPRLRARLPVSGAGASTYTDAVLLAGGFLFAAGYHDQVVCWSVLDPDHPVERGRLTVARPGALAFAGGLLFAGGRAVIAVSPAGALALVQDLGRGPASDLVVSGGFLHAALDNALATWAIDGPDSLELRDVRSVSRIRCLAVDGDLLWAGTGLPNPRLKAFAIDADGTASQAADAAATGFVAFYSLAARDGRLLAGDRWLRSIDVTDPAHPVFAAEPDEPAYPQLLAASDGVLLVADGPVASLYAAGAGAPGASLEPLAAHDVVQSILHAAGNASRFYLARNSAGLVVLDAGDPAATPAVRQASTWFGELAASDSLLVSGFAGILRTFTLADPGAPQPAGSLDLGAHIRAVALRGTTVLVSLATAHLVMVDVSDPAHPAVVAHDPDGLLAGDSVAVAWADSLALDYHADGFLRVVRRDASAVLTTVSTTALAGEPRGLATIGPVAYVLAVDAWNGGSVLTAFDPGAAQVLGAARREDAGMLALAAAQDRLFTLSTGAVLRWWPDCRSLD
ncbi:MAG TPA: hypothetical protein PLQ13_01920 [Candidatus Krumholzibacteria bacterium]|nr:hypothetical protein [Candidatus Krumholzibacteria bacterium]